jgi:hypothetical protein
MYACECTSHTRDCDWLDTHTFHSFEQGRVAFDDDLLANSKTATETLVRVNTRIGKAVNVHNE